MRWPRERVPMTRPQKVIAAVLGLVEFGKFVAQSIRDRRKPRRLDATEHPLRSERIPVEAVRESGHMGVNDGTE